MESVHYTALFDQLIPDALLECNPSMKQLLQLWPNEATLNSHCKAITCSKVSWSSF